MAKVKIQGHASGTGILTVTAPNTSTDRTITLPDATGTLLNSDGDGSSLTGVADATKLPLAGGTVTGATNFDTTAQNQNLVVRETNDGNSNTGIQIQKKHATLHPAGYYYGHIKFEGWDGDQYRRAGVIECIADGTPANDNMPGKLVFSTNSGTTTQTTRLTLTADGRGLSQFTAKAWINFNGTGTIAINDSHNISSITDNGTGDYTVTYSNAMGNTNYSFALSAEAKGSSADDVISINKTTAAQSASAIALWTVRVVHGTSTNVDYDSTTVCVQVFGD